mmetsp:Transcript_30277/g.53226  ORF Transcript_30277/g.53226 Transcript_30277/m.53226 type:complete len:154 (+) Transcript_30277:3-464(+)
MSPHSVQFCLSVRRGDTQWDEAAVLRLGRVLEEGHTVRRSPKEFPNLFRAKKKIAKAKWNGAIVAESELFEEVEGNVYFPIEKVNTDYIKQETDHTTVCPWKGTANYYTIEVDGEKNENAAWTYHEPKEAARNIKDHVAFWAGVEVTTTLEDY